MIELFSSAGQQRLDEIVGARLLCVFDFDGTLAPIVPDPSAASLPQEIRRKLETLSMHAPVAILTGRGIEDVSERLGFAPDFILGNHGIEGMPGWEQRAALYGETCQAWQAQLDEALGRSTTASARQATLDDHGIFIENKRYSLSVHYRNARNPEQMALTLADFFSGMAPKPRVIAGKCVFNLLPENAAHKGSALEELMQFSKASSALYIGDDITDEDAFRLRRPDLMSIRIEYLQQSAAEFFVPRFEDVSIFLDQLTDRLRSQNAGNWWRTDRH